jgi:hypothetical protein
LTGWNEIMPITDVIKSKQSYHPAALAPLVSKSKVTALNRNQSTIIKVKKGM